MRKFKTESKKLLDLMINSIYTNREIFLRELISNASDAVDKLYFKSLTDSDIQLAADELGILVSFDKDARTITVSDSGIGMTSEELDRNLGTIAHSGSLEFKTENPKSKGTDDGADGAGTAADDETAADGASAPEASEGATAEASAPADAIDIIGQFGVGFYSAFMVADHVRVVSKAYGSDEAFAWESNGVEGYTVSPAERAGHGTDVILTLKPSTDEADYDSFLSQYALKDLIKKYSNYVRYPIRMEVSKSRPLPKPEDAGDDYKTEYEQYTELETMNSMVPIWKRKRSDVTDEEYAEFYKADFHDFADPLRTVSLHAEGALTYDALLFVPSRPPYDLYARDFKKGLALYSSNVLIMDKCEELLPDYFGFVRGVVASDDLTLNISRETLQHDRQLHAIAKRVEKKIKSELAGMRDTDREAYEAFFADFGRSIKLGIYTSYGMAKGQLADLLLFYSARQQKMVTLDEYVEGMRADQGSIYYAAGDSIDRVVKTPVVKSVLAKGFDVLVCTDEVDEFCIQAMQGYAEKPFANVAGGDLDLASDEQKEAAEQSAKDNAGLLSAMKDALGDAVSKVVVSSRLTDAPACVTAEGPISLEMEKVFAQNRMPGEEPMKASRVLELNADHAVFATLAAAQAAGDAEKVRLYANVLYGQALLVEGLPIEDPAAYAEDVCALMVADAEPPAKEAE